LQPAPPPSGVVRSLINASAGADSFGLGVAFGLDAKSKMDASDANGHCQPSDRCDARGLALRSSALTSASFSTAAFVVGAASWPAASCST
jgi:hypothetical protein